MKTKKKNGNTKTKPVTMTISIDDAVDLMRGCVMHTFADDGKTALVLRMNKEERPIDLEDALFNVEAIWECQDGLEGDDENE